MADFIDELKEDLQQEKFAKLWAETKAYIIGGVAFVVVTTAASVVWKDYTIRKQEALGTELYKVYATESATPGAVDAIVKSYETLEKNGNVTSAIAALRKAELLAKNGKTDQVPAVYKSVMDDSSSPQEIRRLAEVFYLRSTLGEDTASKLEKMRKLAESSGAFSYTAKELVAISTLESGDHVGAAKLLQELVKDEKTPTRMKERGEEMLSAIEAKYGKASG